MKQIHTGDSAREVAGMLLKEMLAAISRRSDSSATVNIALSGGSTPAILFDVWVERFREVTPWERLRLYWVDERCVDSADAASNYRLAKERLLDKVPLDAGQVFRICGECEPEEEVARYAALVLGNLPLCGRIPVFDFVLLGIGEDGHTSSVFPGQEKLLYTLSPYAVSTHPVSGQRRIAMTGEVMVHARHTWFYVTGGNKAGIVRMLSCPDVRDRYPAAYIWQSAERVELFTDIRVVEPV